MFQSLPHHFRKHGLAADVRTLLLLRQAMEKKLVNTTGDLFLLLRSLVAKSPKDYGPFTVAFYEYFLEIEIKKGTRLDDAIMRSQTFQEWKKALLEEENLRDKPDMHDLIDRYLNEIHMTTFDLKKALDGQQILQQDDPNRPDDTPQNNHDQQRTIKEAIDYRNVSLEELLERLEKVRQQQKSKHSGGDHWIGTGGRSPYGNNGAAPGGVRVGGTGGGKMARAVIGDPNFYPIDTKVTLTDDNIDAALAALKGIEEEAAQKYLDVPTTIQEGLKQGGIFLPIEKEKINPKIQVALLIDNGGWSMTPYVRSITKLFSKMDKRFAHDLKTYYFHNTINGGAYSDARRTQFVPLDKILQLDKNYSVFIIGDADMAPYELGRSSVENWLQIKERFKRCAWLNPLNEAYWYSADTVPVLARIFSMLPLTPDGIAKAVKEMNKKRSFFKV